MHTMCMNATCMCGDQCTNLDVGPCLSPCLRLGLLLSAAYTKLAWPCKAHVLTISLWSKDPLWGPALQNRNHTGRHWEDWGGDHTYMWQSLGHARDSWTTRDAWGWEGGETTGTEGHFIPCMFVAQKGHPEVTDSAAQPLMESHWVCPQSYFGVLFFRP